MGLGYILESNTQTEKSLAFELLYETYAQGRFWTEPAPVFSDATTDIFEIGQLSSNILMLNTRFNLKQASTDGVFVGLAMGMHQFRTRININDIARISNTQLTLAPEVGFGMNSFDINLRYFPPNASPEFDQVDQSNSRTIVYRARNLSMLTVQLTYSIPITK